MKRYIFPLIATALTANAGATERPDTLLSTTGSSTAIISESPSGLKVMVKKLEGDQSESVFIQDYTPNATMKAEQHTSSFSELTLSDGTLGIKVKNRKWEIVSSGFCLGLVNATGQPDGLGLQWGKSLEISWVNALAVRYRTRWQWISLGIGFDWRNYKITTSNHHLTPNGLGGVGIAPYPEDASAGASRLKVFSLGVPLLYNVKIPRTPFSVTLGGILNFNTHASLKTWYTGPEGNHMEEYSEDFHPRRVTVDLFGSLNIMKGCGLYVRYSPQTVLHGHASPTFRPLSMGIILFM